MAWHGRTWYHISRMSGRGSQAGRKHTQITHSLIHSLTLSLSHSYLSPSPLFPTSSKIRFVPFEMKPLFGPPNRNGGNGLLICNRRDSARWGHYLEETRARPARIRRVSRRGRGRRATPGTRSWLPNTKHWASSALGRLCNPSLIPGRDTSAGRQTPWYPRPGI